MALILAEDFLENPLYDIALTFQAETELPKLIEVIEKDILEELLGCDLYDLFIADLNGDVPQIPQAAIYLNIFNSICIDEDSIRSYGIKDLLMAFVYFEWHRYNQNKSVSSGIVRADSENTSLANLTSTNIYEKYNRGIKSYQAIQRYICDNSTDYPEYEGMKKQFASWI